jgi:predicted nuclease of predicted toxin-antitoxin system
LKLKLDENLGGRGAALLRGAGHDVETVVDEGVCSATDSELIGLCKTEGRCVVTLDLDFANPLLFKPADYPGIAVLRLPDKARPEDLRACIETLSTGLEAESVEGELWIVQRNRIRKYQPGN